MAKLLRWPISYHAAVPLFLLVVVFSTVSFHMLPKSSTWVDNWSSLFTHVMKNSSSASAPPSLPNFADNWSSWAPAFPSVEAPAFPSVEAPAFPSDEAPGFPSVEVPAVTPTAQEDVQRNESFSVAEVSEGPSWPPVVAPGAGDDIPFEGEPFVPSVETSASPVPSPALPESAAEERFLVPLLSFQVGAGNQFMEYLSAAVMARALNRTLCLMPFFPGPSRHTGRVTSGLKWEERYQVSSLSRFTRVASLQQCLEACDRTLDDKWMLKTSREPKMGKYWTKYPANKEALNLNWDYVKWTAPEDIATTLGSRSARCVGMLGLFPGLRWRGAFLAISAFIQPAARIRQVADALQKKALGHGTPYMAVHWRFEESECRGQHVGLCFVRCDDGSVIDSGLRPEAQEWHKAGETKCNTKGHLRGVTLHKNDILDTIHERALSHNVSTIYLATDGWLRGAASVSLVKEIVESLRKRGLTVVGLWKVPGLPNFRNGEYFEHLGKDLNGAQVALVEQELCSRSVSFMGSGPSTFSLSVFRVRLARRRVKQIEASVDANTNAAMDELIAETLLRDAHPAGLHCRYLRHMRRHRVNETVETYADEYPDGWLDLEACEGRIGRGGRCQVAECF